MRMKKKLMYLFAAMLLALPGIAGAAAVNANLTFSDILPDGPVYGTVAITETNATTVHNVHFGIDEFAFNSDLSQLSSLKVSNGPSGWNVNSGAFPMDGFGNFELQYDAGNHDPTNPLAFDLRYKINGTYQNITAEDFFFFSTTGYRHPTDTPYHFAIHVVGLDLSNCNSSAYFADSPIQTAVPEPGTMMLLGSGLIGLAGLGRKKFRN
jgi:hypothetical protein